MPTLQIRMLRSSSHCSASDNIMKEWIDPLRMADGSHTWESAAPTMAAPLLMTMQSVCTPEAHVGDTHL